MTAQKLKNITIQKLPENEEIKVIDGGNVTPRIESSGEGFSVKTLLGIISQFVAVGGDFV